VRNGADDLMLCVKVTPRAARSTIAGMRDGEVLVRTTAAPADGAANADVIIQIARAFGVAKSAVHLVRGTTSRHKQLRIVAPRRRPAWFVEADAS
jgi:uncharacterized protein (TIGR00251 family)